MGNSEINTFNVRVYGLYVKNLNLLVTDEIRKGIKMTKLPGGGLEYGEGISECLKREWQEELEVNIAVGDIFYVNPFLQVSAFSKKEQVISMYFWVEVLSEWKVDTRDVPMDFVSEQEGQQIFRWISLKELTIQDFTFPIDQSLVSPLKAFLL